MTDLASTRAPRFQAYLGHVEGRSVLTMRRHEWEAMAGHVREGGLVLLKIEATALAAVTRKASAIALGESFGAGRSRIVIYRHDEKDAPTPYNVDRYVVIEDVRSRWNLEELINRASTEDNENFRSYLRENVFLVKEDPGPDHWLPSLPGEVEAVIRATGHPGL